MMEEEFEAIEVEYACLEEDEIDPTYEFDAPQFCDFLRPETLFDDAEAEQWFETAQSHDPSPFLLKFKWRPPAGIKTAKEKASKAPETKPASSNSSASSKSKVSSFMKPTQSNLAKQKNVTELQCTQSCRIKSQESSAILSKRQKLETGYLKKAAHLKHQAQFAHKKTKENNPSSGVNVASKPKATIPKEPILETATRAQRHKDRTDAEISENTKSSIKARPLNKKILQAPGQSLQNKKTQRGEGALNSGSNTNTREHQRKNSGDGPRQEKCGMTNKIQGKPEDMQKSSKVERGVFRNIKVYPLDPNDKRLNYEPPADLLSKLSLVSDMKKPVNLPPKDLKENTPGYLHQEYEMKPVKEATCGKQYRCILVTQQTYLLELGH